MVGLNYNAMFYKTFVSMLPKQNLFVSVFVLKCLMMLNNVEYTTSKMFVTQMSSYLFVISFQLMFYKTLRYRLARALWSGSWPTSPYFCPVSGVYQKGWG